MLYTFVHAAWWHKHPVYLVIRSNNIVERDGQPAYGIIIHESENLVFINIS